MMSAAASFGQGIAAGPCTAVVKIQYKVKGGVSPQIDGGIVLPAYPADRQRAGVAAEVAFEFLLEEDGSVNDVTIKDVKSPEDSRSSFQKSTEIAIKSWKFMASDKQPNTLKYPLKVSGIVRFSPVDEES